MLGKFNYFSMLEHICLLEGATKGEASIMFNNAAHKFVKDAFSDAWCKSIMMYHTHVLEQEMSNKIAQDLHLTKEEYLQGKMDWLVKDLEACDWLCG